MVTLRPWFLIIRLSLVFGKEKDIWVYIANKHCFHNLLHANYIANNRNSMLLLFFNVSHPAETAYIKKQ